MVIEELFTRLGFQVDPKGIDKAKSSLVNTFDSLSEIAEQCGISDVNYFIRIFKSEVGISPLKYRKNTK